VSSITPRKQLEQFVPQELMTKLETARSTGSMVGERRVVTILFCDVKGSTAAAEQLDPEDWTEIINGAFEHMIKPVYSYEGTVARLTGDGILAFFGAPITHEDDPQRAVLAGLDIVSAIELYKVQVGQRWGIDFSVRVGINTGRVVVGAVGSDLRMEYTAMGDAINLAARMEQTASPGTVQVADDTYRLVSPLFEFEELGGVEVKGKAAPVPAYRVLKRSATPGRVRGIKGLEIDLIGRDRELASLSSAIDDVARGVGHIVCLTGEAGLGKSRLIRELKKSQAASRANELTSPESSDGSRSVGDKQTEDGNLEPQWYETTSLSYETAQPYALFRRLVRRLNGINHNDRPSVLREKLAALSEFIAADQGPSSLEVFEALFGLESENGSPPLEGEAFKQALFKLMPSLWRQRFENQPTIIVFDDLHWSDPASVALLVDLLPLIEEMAIVFICVFRPERGVPGWHIKETADETFHHRFTEIILRPLSVRQSEEMIDALLGNPDLPDDLRQLILERADGNPFFIEEVIRTLIDEGAIVADDSSNGRPKWRVAGESADIHIPDNLQALLTARIDHLSEEARQTLQLASVIGRNFYRRILKMINETSEELDSHINTLLRQDMIRESARVPEIEYRFRNPLTQEAAYRTILLKRRREFHRRVGEVMETIFAEQLEEQAPQLAFHFREAHQYGQALVHFRKAGDVAYRLFANEEASTHYGEAIEMARLAKEPVASDILLHLYSRRGRALEHQVAHEAAMANYQTMLTHAQEQQDQELALAAMMAMATILSTSTPIQDVNRSRELSEEALILAQSLGDRAAEAKINWNLMNTVAFSGGDMEEGLSFGEASLKIAREMDLRDQIAYTLNSMIMIYWNNSLIAKGIVLLDEVRAIWHELDNQPMLADSTTMTGFSLLMIGDYKSALETFEELERLSQAINNTWNLNSSKLFIGMSALQVGEIDRGITYANKAIELGEQLGLHANVLLAKAMLAGVYSLFGKCDDAMELALDAYQRREEAPDFERPLILGLVCAAYVRCQAFSQAEEVLESLSEYERSSGNDWFAAFIIGAEAELALSKDRPEDVLESIEPHIPRLKESGIHSTLPYLLFLRGQAHLALGNHLVARSSFEQALEESEGTGEQLWRWEILRSLVEMASANDSDENSELDEWREKAAETIAFIAENIRDADFRRDFLLRPGVSTLVGTDILE
jgi:class 3 adenylate cyclase/tetratricopeptide (TPR) repeat protein